jgi:hypothetical protein
MFAGRREGGERLQSRKLSVGILFGLREERGKGKARDFER